MDRWKDKLEARGDEDGVAPWVGSDGAQQRPTLA